MYLLGLVIVCIICIMWYLDALDVPKLLFLAVMGAISVGCNIKSGGGVFTCDISKPYGSRCVETNETNGKFGFSDKRECDTYCMRRREIIPTHNVGKVAEKLIHMIHDLGWNYPVPRWFLQQLADSAKAQEKFYKTINMLSMRLFNTTHLTTNAGLLMKKLLGVDTEIIQLNSAAPLELSDDLQCYTIITSLGSGEHISHANSIIIGKNRKIIHIEPHFGANEDANPNLDAYKKNTEKISAWLAKYLASGYTIISTDTCLPGMQTLSDLGGICGTWSEFLGIWMAMNVDKSPDEVFRYAIGNGPAADIMLQIYVFYARSVMENPTTILETYRDLTLKRIEISKDKIINIFKRTLAAPPHIQSIVMLPFGEIIKHVETVNERVLRTGDLTISLDELQSVDMICYTNFCDSWFDIVEKDGIAAGYIELCKMFGIDIVRGLERLRQPELEKFTLYVEKHMGATDDQIRKRQSMNINEVNLWYNTLKLYEYYKTPNKTYMQIMTA